MHSGSAPEVHNAAAALGRFRRRRPLAGFLPVTMKLFWQLYPELEARTISRLGTIQSRLAERLDLASAELAGNRSEADAAGRFLRGREIDLLVVWANGYVSSDIAIQAIDHLPGTPIVLLLTQRDTTIPAGMDYARYMENTAATPLIELGGALAKSGRAYTTIAGQDSDDAIYAQAQRIAEAARVRCELHRLNIGSVGYPYPGMLDIVVDERAVNQLGPKITRISLPELGRRFAAIPEGRAREFIQETNHLYITDFVDPDDVVRQARVYCAVEDMVDEYGLDAVCMHDYECASSVTGAISEFALAMLEYRKGTACGVEGDIPNTIGAFILSHLTGAPSMFVDWTMFDRDQNALFFQHNGKADPSMVNRAILKPTAEPFGIVGEGAVFEVMGKPGPVTMLSMMHDGRHWKLFAAEGEALPADPSPCRLNQILVRVPIPVEEFLPRVCDLGLTHHLNVSHGSVLETARRLAQMLGVEFLTV